MWFYKSPVSEVSTVMIDILVKLVIALGFDNPCEVIKVSPWQDLWLRYPVIISSCKETCLRSVFPIEHNVCILLV